jgi:hypothetical protein
LIVEFAREKRRHGLSTFDATMVRWEHRHCP